MDKEGTNFSIQTYQDKVQLDSQNCSELHERDISVHDLSRFACQNLNISERKTVQGQSFL